MKKIVRRIPAHTVRLFQCEVCGTKYRTEKQAKQCEARKNEKKVFKKGDLVKVIESYVCSHGRREKIFQPKGVVVSVIGPMPSDYEYEKKWLGEKPERLNGHVYVYEVLYQCVCGSMRGQVYRTPELLLVKSKNR